MEQLRTSLKSESRIDFAEETKRPQQTLAERLAHRLRNPLTTIMACCSQLTESGESEWSESDRKFLDWIAEAADVQAGVLDRVVKAFGTLHVTPHVCNLAEAALRATKLEKPAEHVSLKIVLPQEELEVVADYNLLNEILAELLNNAVESGADEILITCGSDKEYAWLRLAQSATDGVNGWQERYGEPFFTTKAGHSGLGVPIARRYAQLFGGTIEIENNHDGMAVLLTLPRYTGIENSPGKGIWYAEDPDC